MTWNDLDLEQVQLLPYPLFRFRCRDFGANDLRDSDSYCDCGGCHGGCYCKEKLIGKNLKYVLTGSTRFEGTS